MTHTHVEVPNNHIQIGGRKLKLAVVQLNIVKNCIEAAFPDVACSVLALLTLGDKFLQKPLYLFGGKSLWTKELEALLLEPIADYPQLDLVVHLLKDMPTNLPDEFELGCILEREDPRDVAVMRPDSPYKCIADLPHGAVVGTLSLRRQAQLARCHPHLRFQDVRGNLATRLGKLDAPDLPYDCIILAAAGLVREGLGHRITYALDAPEMYYAVGQGALGIEIRRGDTVMRLVLALLEHRPTTFRCIAERSMMRRLEGGCLVPLGVHTVYDEATEELYFKGVIVSPDGEQCVEAEVVQRVACNNDAERAGEAMAARLAALGGRDILSAINYEKINQRPVAVHTPVPELASHPVPEAV